MPGADYVQDVRGRRFLLSIAVAAVLSVLVPACADLKDGDGWRPCSESSFDATTVVGSTFELTSEDFSPDNVSRAAVCRLTSTPDNVDYQAQLSADQIKSLHKALAAETPPSDNCPLEASISHEVLIVVVEFTDRDDNAQFNLSTGEVGCESLLLDEHRVSADQLGRLVRGWVPD
ncbi:hypothetical protein [Nocardioides sp.]|uniref:hypothetical protein n=1 Tax=Nocardioides sp. TaxID=35761 RepID=UPI00356B3F0E